MSLAGRGRTLGAKTTGPEHPPRPWPSLLGFSIGSKRELYENAQAPQGRRVFPVRLNLVLNNRADQQTL